ncbi:hypothetical protein AB1L07_01365 [Niallia alba]|uniref:hypothetical protein n=1 Tax=Niallia alba TaxID=2729105 RepID=UPI00399FF49B
MMGLVALLGTILFVVSIFMFMRWIVHIAMNVECVDKWGWGNYRLFKKYFKEIEWEIDKKYKGSLFAYNQFSIQTSKIHADIFKFNGIHMAISDPVSYWLCQIYVQKYINNNFKEDFTNNSYKWQ